MAPVSSAPGVAAAAEPAAPAGTPPAPPGQPGQRADAGTPGAAGAPPGPAPDPAGLGRLLGLPDLPDRLAAVERRVTETLQEDGALLGPATLRVAANGGKRLRPLLAIACAAAGDVFDEDVVTAAAAVELVQMGSLVHDDILDEATTRRGEPTINSVEGLNHAVLAGDYLLARAAELAASVGREAADAVARATRDLCEGQALELRDAYDPDRTIDAYLATIHGKTAALFACACRLGARCAGLSDDSAAALARFGEGFGMSFQILDDVLDLVGDPEQLGKPTGSDVAGGVYTLPVLTALDGSPVAGELRRTVTGPDVDPHAAVDLVRRSGSIPAAVGEIDRYADSARRSVGHLDQTAVGEGLGAFPHAYSTWALETLIDHRALQVLTAAGGPGR